MSLKKIAEESGVSVATVSRVLNNPNYKCSSAEMSEKIWSIARKLNYVPNISARNLRNGVLDVDSKIYYVDVLYVHQGISELSPQIRKLLRVIESELYTNKCILSNTWVQTELSDEKMHYV